MKKKSCKLVLIILMIIFIINIMMSPVKAMQDIISGVQDFENSRQSLDANSVTGGMEIDSGDLQNISNIVYNVLLTVGIVVAVIVGLILGMKFMAGSIDQKAQVKETLIPYIAGCIVIFSAFGIWKLVVTILNQME